MLRRRSGQEAFGFAASERVSALDEWLGLIDWAPIEAALESIPVAARRRGRCWRCLEGC